MSEGNYKFLTKNFFKGSTKGQINSVYKGHAENPEKVAEYKVALDRKDCILKEPLTKNQVKKLSELGISIKSEE